jgi:murein DD-endopeptidase MepM/ murein hydrolase activator NlpD
MRKLIAFVTILVAAAAVAYVAAGFSAGPAITIASPAGQAGAGTPVDVSVTAPGGRLTVVSVAVTQGGASTALGGFSPNVGGQPRADVKTSGGDRSFHLTGVIGTLGLKSGPATLTVTAARSTLFGLRTVESTATHDFQIQLEPPAVAVLSTKHYINLGGSEFIVYRATPAGVASGVRVGDLEYPGFPASGLDVPGVTITDPAIHVAFFALLYDQPLQTPMVLYARDAAGNVATSTFDHRTFPKAFKSSRIDLPDAFLERAVPAILAGTQEINPQGDLLARFLAVNGDLRRKNAATIAAEAAHTSSSMLWGGVPFHAYANNKVEAAFADFRTYIYKGKEVDKQVHLGFDLASFANTPIAAANRGTVVFAGPLGIYGNCVIIDHGLGVQSLYGHLSSIDVKAGATVEKDQTIGKSGMTGLAAGDHLHFTMLVNGHMVNPIEWWDPHWITDRIMRKLLEVRKIP